MFLSTNDHVVHDMSAGELSQTCVLNCLFYSKPRSMHQSAWTVAWCGTSKEHTGLLQIIASVGDQLDLPLHKVVCSTYSILTTTYMRSSLSSWIKMSASDLPVAAVRPVSRKLNSQTEQQHSFKNRQSQCKNCRHALAPCCLQLVQTMCGLQTHCHMHRLL